MRNICTDKRIFIDGLPQDIITTGLNSSLFDYFEKYGPINCLYIPVDTKQYLLGHAYLTMQNSAHAKGILHKRFHVLTHIRITVSVHPTDPISGFDRGTLTDWCRVKANRSTHREVCPFARLNEYCLQRLLYYLPGGLADCIRLERVCSCLLIGLRSIWSARSQLTITLSPLEQNSSRTRATLSCNSHLSGLLQRFADSLVQLSLCGTYFVQGTRSMRVLETVISDAPHLTSLELRDVTIQDSEVFRVMEKISEASQLQSLVLARIQVLTNRGLAALLKSLPPTIENLEINQLENQLVPALIDLPSSLLRLTFTHTCELPESQVISLIGHIMENCTLLEELNLYVEDRLGFVVIDEISNPALLTKINNWPATGFSNLHSLTYGVNSISNDISQLILVRIAKQLTKLIITQANVSQDTLLEIAKASPELRSLSLSDVSVLFHDPLCTSVNLTGLKCLEEISLCHVHFCRALPKETSLFSDIPLLLPEHLHSLLFVAISLGWEASSIGRFLTELPFLRHLDLSRNRWLTQECLIEQLHKRPVNFPLLDVKITQTPALSSWNYPEYQNKNIRFEFQEANHFDDLYSSMDSTDFSGSGIFLFGESILDDHSSQNDAFESEDCDSDFSYPSDLC